VAFEEEAKKAGVPHWSFNGDAFSHAMKKQVVACIQKHWPEGVDLVIYSLASPRRVDPDTGEIYQSCLKTLGETYTNQTVNIHTGEFSQASLTPATPEEVQGTVKVMGGEDWQLWIQTLLDNQCLSQQALTLAYSYIGSEITDPMYRSGTIGQAKMHLEETAIKINRMLEEKIQGHAYISVNKAVVTQAAAAIPVLPLYCAILYKVMNNASLHEGCTEQMIRLFKDKLYGEKGIVLDADQMIRMDDYELSREIQNEVKLRFKKINPDNLNTLADLDMYRRDFMRLFGFEVDGVDYEQDVAINLPMRSLEEIGI
jgi:enoyl-[acyl-carrier protein] reductase/trans-2-enoyl-CoA reductase (NAD+)